MFVECMLAAEPKPSKCRFGAFFTSMCVSGSATLKYEALLGTMEKTHTRKIERIELIFLHTTEGSYY